jgi:biotin carboxyl carrier protein
MTKDQAANLNMDKTTLAVLTKPENAAFVASIPILADFITELEDNIDAQESYGETQENASDGVPEDKEVKRTKSCRLSATMAGLVYSFATNTGNTILAGQMKITFSELSKTKDAQLADRCRFIHATATINQVAATPYGVTV